MPLASAAESHGCARHPNDASFGVWRFRWGRNCTWSVSQTADKARGPASQDWGSIHAGLICLDLRSLRRDGRLRGRSPSALIQRLAHLPRRAWLSSGFGCGGSDPRASGCGRDQPSARPKAAAMSPRHALGSRVTSDDNAAGGGWLFDLWSATEASFDPGLNLRPVGRERRLFELWPIG